MGVFTYYGRVAAFLVELLFSFIHLHERLEMLSFPPSIFGSRFWLYLHTCVSQLRSWFIFRSNPFLIIANTFSLY